MTQVKKKCFYMLVIQKNQLLLDLPVVILIMSDLNINLDFFVILTGWFVREECVELRAV